jgi:hypothetical protein
VNDQRDYAEEAFNATHADHAPEMNPRYELRACPPGGVYTYYAIDTLTDKRVRHFETRPLAQQWIDTNNR